MIIKEKLRKYEEFNFILGGNLFQKCDCLITENDMNANKKKGKLDCERSKVVPIMPP